MQTTTVPAPETDRIIALTPNGTATLAVYRLLRSLDTLGDADRRDVLALLDLELADRRG